LSVYLQRAQGLLLRTSWHAQSSLSCHREHASPCLVTRWHSTTHFQSIQSKRPYPRSLCAPEAQHADRCALDCCAANRVPHRALLKYQATPTAPGRLPLHCLLCCRPSPWPRNPANVCHRRLICPTLHVRSCRRHLGAVQHSCSACCRRICNQARADWYAVPWAPALRHSQLEWRQPHAPNGGVPVDCQPM
jgi:hypothetical protein